MIDRYSAAKQWGEGGTYIDKNDDDIDKDSTTGFGLNRYHCIVNTD
jgi:hypothetical protein